MDQIRKLLVSLQNRVEVLERGQTINKLTIPSTGYLVVQKVTTDPASPIEGQLWENITTKHLKIYLNGTVTTII